MSDEQDIGELSERRKALAVRIVFWSDILLALACAVMGAMFFWNAEGAGYEAAGGKFLIICAFVFLLMALMVRRYPVFAIVLHFLFLILLLSI